MVSPLSSQILPSLKGKVALVTGATRGIGKGIALGLGEAGATVYITGRRIEAADDSIGGSLGITQTAVEQAGGYCISVRTDHSDDAQVQALFERIKAEQGQLDVLVNNVYGGVSALRSAFGKPFWQSGPELWDACHQVGLRSHYVASIYAAQMMTPRQQGMICNISSWGGLSQIFGVAYGSGKAGCDRMSADMALDLKPYNVASLSLWPGIVGTEHMTQLAEEMSDENRQSSGIAERYNWETPLLTGRVIAALAADPQVMRRTGRVQIVAELAKYYGLVDKGGECPASLRSLTFILPNSIPALRQHSWLVPDIRVPWWVLLLIALKSPRI
ncbi:MAG: SDR family NAD(P)-dependent oxidoreductase [Cyanobacteria bacterium P01_A01_bin.137]